MPEDDNLVIVPYAHGKSRADADFTVNCFSTLPGLHLRAYSRSEEWHHFYTYKLKWGPLVQAELSVRLPPGEDGRVRPGAEGSAATAVALRFPGLPSGCLANLQWEEASGAASRRPEADTGVLLDGSCLAFTVGSGSSYRVRRPTCRGIARGGQSPTGERPL